MKTFDNQQPELADLKAVMALMEHGTVTRAAQTLGTSQSALSYQLDRMRKRFGDALFVRIGNRMAATPFTERLAEPATRVLRIMETEIGGLQSFDAATTRREFRIGMNELGAITLVPRLVKRLSELAPHAMLSPVQMGSENLSAALESGQLDIAAGFFTTSDPRLFQQRLYQRDYVCIARKDHPQVGASLSWLAFSQARKVHTGAIPVTTAWLETQLRKASFAPSVTMSIQHIAAIPFYRRRQRHGGHRAARAVRAVFAHRGAEDRAPAQSHSSHHHPSVLASEACQRPFCEIPARTRLRCCQGTAWLRSWAARPTPCSSPPCSPRSPSA